jgi:hypothetical protein
MAANIAKKAGDGLVRHLLLLVAQHLAGGLVDKVYPGAGRAGQDFIAVRSIGWRRFGQPNLNVQTGPDTSKDEVGHALHVDAAVAGAL